MTEKKRKKIDYRHYICILITLGFVVCAVFLFPHALGRVLESFRDIGTSFVYFFYKMMGMESPVNPTVNTLPKYPFFDFIKKQSPANILPDTFNGFKDKWLLYWRAFASSGNLNSYLMYLANKVYKFSIIIMFVLPFIILSPYLFKRHITSINNNYNVDSKPLIVFKRFENKVYLPLKKMVRGFIAFISKHGVYLKLWLCIWLFNFNVFAIIIEFFAYYFYFTASFDVASLYIQFYKLFLDLSVPIFFIPVWIWIVVGLFMFDRFRKNIAYRILNHMEMRNRGFINDRSIVIFVCGTMGKSKTTMITDMSLSQEANFRDKAFEKMIDNDMKFPYFPWINLSNAIREEMEKHKTYTWATCEKFIADKYLAFCSDPCNDNIFGYDHKKHGMTYDDKLKITDVWEVILIYAKLFFLLMGQTSRIMSNYSIRVDNVFLDEGNIPIWETNFFKRDSSGVNEKEFSHILDFDMLRLGKKVDEESKFKDMFEFGVVTITEIGKERGNKYDLDEIKKKDFDANLKNDLFNTMLKMIRHASVIDNYTFQGL